ncbi:hypothetical protein Ahy_B03g068849 [Arachis hypogaea]|uniref:Uncharacterized protein n=1 Tax=Arachis hypogaea TaxID=3818 RepID=A0A445ABD9_ARAHY|nr:hypothetical protein Ahy_B03g068849 [Arachis hypogaea]
MRLLGMKLKIRVLTRTKELRRRVVCLKKVSPKKNESKKGGSSNSRPSQLPRTAKKRTSKKYSGVRRRHILRDGLGKEGIEGQNNGPRPSIGAGQTNQRHGPVGGSDEGPSMGDGPRMPCCHAVVAMYKIGLKPEDHVHKWLTMQSIKATYMHCIKPVNSEEYWTLDGGSNVNLNNDNVQPAPPMDPLVARESINLNQSPL